MAMVVTVSVYYSIDEEKLPDGDLIGLVHKFGFEAYAPTRAEVEKRIEKAVLRHLAALDDYGLSAKLGFLADRGVPFQVEYKPVIATNGSAADQEQSRLEVKAPVLA